MKKINKLLGGKDIFKVERKGLTAGTDKMGLNRMMTMVDRKKEAKVYSIESSSEN